MRHFLLFSSQLAVRGIPFNLSSQEDIILPITGSPSNFVAVDFSAEDDAIFFSDTAKDIIYKQNVDGTGERLSLKNARKKNECEKTTPFPADDPAMCSLLADSLDM